nr:hypothetical protein Iba_chr07dCG5410 [Ipomoea batatas]
MEVVAAAHRRRKPVPESLTPSGEGKSVSSTAARHSPKDPSEKTTSPVCWFVDHPFGAAARCRYKEQRKPTPAGVPDSLSDAEEGSSSSRSSDRRASCCFAPTLPWPAASTHRPPLAKSGVADVQEMRGEQHEVGDTPSDLVIPIFEEEDPRPPVIEQVQGDPYGLHHLPDLDFLFYLDHVFDYHPPRPPVPFPPLPNRPPPLDHARFLRETLSSSIHSCPPNQEKYMNQDMHHHHHIACQKQVEVLPIPTMGSKTYVKNVCVSVNSLWFRV